MSRYGLREGRGVMSGACTEIMERQERKQWRGDGGGEGAIYQGRG